MPRSEVSNISQKDRADKNLTSLKETVDRKMQLETKWPELSKVVSLQKIFIKSKGKVEKITETYEEVGKLDQRSNVSSRKQMLARRPKTQAASRSKPRNASRLVTEKVSQDRPASEGLPYISTNDVKLRGEKGIYTNNRAKSLFVGSRACKDIHNIKNLNIEREQPQRPRVLSATRKYFEYPVEKVDEEGIETKYTNKQLCPISHTYLLMLEDNPQPSIKLRNHGLDGNALSVIGNTIENNNHVTELDLEGNLLNDIGIEDLGIILRGNTNIEHLNLSCNQFSSKGIIAIGNLLDANKTLTVLSLSRNKLTDTDLELLCSSLEDSNSNLKTLDLSYNCFTPQVGKTLGEFLSKDIGLKDLRIAGNNLGPTGMSPIFEGLLRNNSLEKLDIACNEVSDKGIKILAQMNCLGRSLKQLDLSDNFVTLKGMRHFVSALDGNHSLTVLRLDNNQIGTNGLILLLESLLEQLNETLSHLHVKGVFADQTIRDLCDKMQKRNSKFALFGVTGNTGNGKDDTLKLLEIYLVKNRFLNSDRSEQIDSIIDIES